MARLQGKVAIITGATGGIGEATALRFLEEGAKVMLVGRSADKLAESRKRLGNRDGLEHFVADATDEAATRDSVAATVKAFGGLDIVFANAGTEGVLRPVQDFSVEEFNHVLHTNVTGVWLSMKYAVPEMIKRGSGSIIATASVAGLIGFATLSPYVASKHAVCGLVKTAALELGEAGIRVNAIAPGPIDNRMMDSLGSQLSPDDPAAARESITASVAMKRYGTNEEVANLALFLASDESSYTTGAVYTIDGGYTAA